MIRIRPPLPALTFGHARVGVHIVDRWGQEARIEHVSRKGDGEIVTRRVDPELSTPRKRVYWDHTAKWTAKEFNTRQWWWIR